MTPSTPDPLALLLGTWRLTRDIPGHATASGQATVEPSLPDHALYHEQVSLHLPTGQQLRGSAAYLFCRRPYGLDVLFPHTLQLFHRLLFTPEPSGALVATSTHPCGDDLYHSTYRIHPGGPVQIDHQVRGPRKNYLSRTTLTRA